jgi:hypothetical protein
MSRPLNILGDRGMIGEPRISVPIEENKASIPRKSESVGQNLAPAPEAGTADAVREPREGTALNPQLKNLRLKERNQIIALRADLKKPGTPLQEALLKDPTLWTKDEEFMIGSHFHDTYRAASPESQAIDDLRGIHFKHNSPDDQPLGIYDSLVAKTKSRPTDPDGILGIDLGQDAEIQGLDAVVRGLQTGMKFIERPNGGVKDRRPLSFAGVDGLKVDGEAGPKTVAATRRAVAALGSEAVARATRVGRFDNILRSNPVEPATLADAAGALFARPGHDGQRRHPTRSLQEGFNALGHETFKPNWRLIAEDGAIGPETMQAYGDLRRLYGPGALARYMGERFTII